MLKKTIKYEDFDGNEREETFYFNLTEAELAEMELSEKGGLTKKLQLIVDTEDTPAIVKFFKEMLLLSFGKKSEDGRRFEKSEELRKEFSESMAFSKLFMELATDDEKAAEFINAIVPKNIATKADVVPIK